MTRYIDPALVDLFVASQGNKAITVTFAKKDGTLTTRNGLPKVFKRRVGGTKGAKQAQVLKDNGLRFFDYPVPRVSESGRVQNGFSFFLNRVTEIRAGGAVVTPKR